MVDIPGSPPEFAADGGCPRHPHGGESPPAGCPFHAPRTPADPPGARHAFFISEFGERFRFIFERFRSVLELDCHACRDLRGGSTYRLVALEHDPQPDVLTALDDAIELADLFIADITPRVDGGPARDTRDGTVAVSWNPNVMYEIGRAQQARAPLFVICDGRFNPTVSRIPLPFDIATLSIHWYDFSPEGLEPLLRRFTAWLKSGIIDKFVTSKHFTSDARRIRDEISGWKPDENRQFIPLVKAITDMLLETVSNVRAHLTRNRPFNFRPTAPGALIDGLFAGTIDRMTAGDAYHAISTLNFWSELGPSSRFFLASRRALGKGVKIKRLFLVSAPADVKDPKQRQHLEDSLVSHVELAKQFRDHYEVKCLPREGGVRNDDPAHCGICVFNRDGQPAVRAFRPHYRPLGSGGPPGASSLTGIDYEVDADAREAEFDRLWADARTMSLEQYVAEIRRAAGTSS